MKSSVLGEWVTGGHAKIDVARLIVTRALIQANSGGGKSWALRRLLEVTAGIVQQLIIDPEGEFATLREKHDLVIAAAHDGDALAHPKTARLLATRLLETQASAVLDLYDLKAPDRHAFVQLFLEELINAPKKLWHPVLVVLDEAHVFCPEKGQGESDATEAVIDLATRGRKRGFCLIAATQRIGKFHKSAAAELKNKLIGSTGMDVDVKRAAFELGLSPKEALAQLRALEAGHFYAFGPALSQVDPRELLVGEVLTTHPKLGDRGLRPPPAPTAAIRALLPKLADLPKEAEQEARTAEELRREVTGLRRELATAKRAAPAAAATVKRLRGAIEALMKFVVQINASGFGEKVGADPEALRKAIDSAVAQALKLIDQKLETRAKTLQAIQREGGRLVASIQKLLGDESVTIALDVKHSEPFTVKESAPLSARGIAAPRPVPRPRSADDGANLPRGEASILAACIQFPDGLRREQLTVLTGYKRSARDTYIQRLGERGFAEVRDDKVLATDDGRIAHPNAEPLPTGEELQRYWFERLPEGERAILKVLVQRHPDSVPRDALTEETGYKRSTRDTYLQRLAAKQLVIKADPFIEQCDRWWLVTGDLSIAKPKEIPESWGWMSATRTGLRIQRPAKQLPQDEARIRRLWAFALIRRAAERGDANSIAFKVELQKQRAEIERQLEQESNYKIAKVAPAFEALRKRVDEFEKASGMKLEDWRLGNVGKLARRLHALKEDSYGGFTKTLKSQLDALQNLSKRIAEALEAVGDPELSGDEDE